VVVDCAVDADNRSPVLGPHRLGAAGEIDDRKPFMTWGGMQFHVKSVAVPAASADRLGHPAQGCEIRLRLVEWVQQADHAAHHQLSPGWIARRDTPGQAAPSLPEKPAQASTT
jgi:hypothetical protein